MFEVEHWDADKPELNITPLVDIMLVLLAILMIATPTITYQEKISLPRGSKNKQTTKGTVLEIRMDFAGKIYVHNKVYSYNTFPSAFRVLAATYDKNTAIYVRADKRLAYEKIIYLLKSIREAGFAKVSLVTSA
ncbi:ExbD/TolR family protein [Helicobacter salomonis]|uniref:ExbD/TolR family protein n=1 Tax=Helicobacter salomonis TaxID=56878 RepID=UPI000CF1B1A1|nr:biopolymer transporter ExbD [Helicobacter salomonis]